MIESMREIGGYFGLELPVGKPFLHGDGYCVNSGRNALELILSNIQDLEKLWIPYYTCEVILEPLKRQGIPYDFYSIDNQLEMANELELHSGEYLLLTNYFGIKDSYISKMAERYGDQLIVDNAQAYYSSPIQGIKTFYSPRKFVGVPDGGIAFIDEDIDMGQFAVDSSWDRCSHLLKRLDINAGAGYADFKANSHALSDQPIKQMSNLTRILLSSIDFERIKEKRTENFLFLHEKLGTSNMLPIGEIRKDFNCPMVYPYCSDDAGLRKRLIDNKVFVATYWPNVLEWCDEDKLEHSLARFVMPIAIDQRYTKEDLSFVINIIKR